MASLEEQLRDGAWSGDLLKVKQAVAAGINVDAVLNQVCEWVDRSFGSLLLVASVGRASDRDGCPGQEVTHGWWP